MARKQPSQRNTHLPGSLYQRNRRWWWKVQLPGEDKPKARPLKPIGSRYAMTDYAVVAECAKHGTAKRLMVRRRLWVRHEENVKSCTRLNHRSSFFIELQL